MPKIVAMQGNISMPSTTVLSSPIRDDQFHCAHGALMGPFGLIVQVMLAGIAFTSLIAKRFCEPRYKRRPWIIWFYDTSKQGIGAAVIHFANVFLADMFTGDPCTWYIVTFLLDSTIGLIVIYLLLKLCDIFVKSYNCLSLRVGEYGDPPQCNIWIGQCGLYLLVILAEKILMTLLLLFKFWKGVRKLIMSPIQNPKVELVLVMFIVPFIINAFIFWVVDNFLKKKLHGGSINHISDTAVKYEKTHRRGKFYKNALIIADDSDSEALLSFDEDNICNDNSDSLVSFNAIYEQRKLLTPNA